MDTLPDFVAPMLAKSGAPFDSDEHLFEIKWDGIRVLAFVEGGGRLRALTRRGYEVAARYPELDALGGVPAGTILDGEVVALRDGKPDFELVLQREQVRDPQTVRVKSAEIPVVYVAFDVLYEGFRPRLDEPLTDRRERLLEICGSVADPRLVASEGVIGAGRDYFVSACDSGLEGVVAKRLDSRYLPGRRTEAWQKIKRSERLYCVVVGFLPSSEDPELDFKSLVVAADDGAGGPLRVVGRVGGGFRAADRERLNAELRARVRATPIVACDEDATWVEPGIYCEVRYVERTRAGVLRAPVFERIVDG